ncbi:GTPase [Fodinicola feengrottensis]|uniref:GTPase n=1 Tax=Fodinicola feengrottensis TaxID=435914 RepID=UPI0013D34105|nr:GTPase [Fodinicola feengrottensis]
MAPVKAWLAELASDGEQWTAISTKTLDGALASLRPRATALVRHAVAQDAAAQDLREDINGAYARESEQLSRTIEGGDILHGEVLARWQEFVSTGELARTIRARDGRFRNQLAAALSGRSLPGQGLSRAIAGALTAALEQAAEHAAEAASQRWSSRPAGAALLASGPGLARASSGFGAMARQVVTEWQQTVLDQTVVSGGKGAAKSTAYASSAAALVVMTAAVLPVGQLVDGLPESHRRSNASASQELVSAVRRTFEDADARRLASRARSALLQSVGALMEGERRRYEARLTEAGVGERTGERLRGGRRGGRGADRGRRPGPAPAEPGRLSGPLVAAACRRAGPPGAADESAISTDPDVTVTESPELNGALERESAQRLATVSNRLDALRRLLESGADRVDDTFLAPGHRLLERSGERLGLSTMHTVVALVGATGSGKSSLFNALSGLELSAVGVRRPTTSTSLPHACIWGPDGAKELLDWLSIAARNQVVRESVLDGDEQAELRGLVLLDLPDHDSTNVTHRLEVDRMIGLVDLLVWVLDPQKYADAAIHQRYLREMANHEQATVVLLNQVDTLEPADVGACLQDVRRLLHEDGLGEVALLPVSARTGAGLDDVRKLFAAAIAERRTAVDRISADLDRVSVALASLSGPPVPEEVDRANQNAIVDDLAQAAGIPALAEEVHGSYLWRAGRYTGWTFARLVGRLRPDPRSAAEREHGNGRAGASGGVVVPRARAAGPRSTALCADCPTG